MKGSRPLIVGKPPNWPFNPIQSQSWNIWTFIWGGHTNWPFIQTQPQLHMTTLHRKTLNITHLNIYQETIEQHSTHHIFPIQNTTDGPDIFPPEFRISQFWGFGVKIFERLWKPSEQDLVFQWQSCQFVSLSLTQASMTHRSCAWIGNIFPS